VKLKNLAKGLLIKGNKEVSITGLSCNSQTVAPGNLFIAKKGLTREGAEFIPQAVNAGASAIATDIYDPFLSLPQIIHPKLSEIEALLAARYYQFPSKELFLVGVTGTKGKTTTSYLIKHLLDGLKKPSGLIGTVETIIGENRFFSTLTTHDVITNQKALREMILKGCKAAVLEVSSHGLCQGRVDEIEFDLAVFTNLYPDHLDYHKSMDDYAAAKRKLFGKADRAIVNADSFWQGSGQLSFGIEKGDIRAQDLVLGDKGTEFRIDGCNFTLPLIGKFNVYNALAAVGVGLELGAPLEKIRDILATFGSVPARLERVGNVFVDFAHTGEALENVLQTLRDIAKGKVIVVFGCGGGRDPGRRAGMARAAEKWADVSIITTDNPRQEDPNEIARQIVSFYEKPPLVELDRKKAIEKALSIAKEEDLVLIAGKGHEKVQIFSHQTIAFDDMAVVMGFQNYRRDAEDAKVSED
jgi:UDP-N-acetylmuramoyl-L-alanyl-D-glutamate--2,6-diaminopimelate ligase